ncbi:MAG: 16S rRNA (guanine(966)-N(2))-methyltransferase RsmD [Firmicutes bacterium]|nr:16S rRNA (guanine(966)-N(2))-methyltransferase RsmD [Bacillota bacterium]
MQIISGKFRGKKLAPLSNQTTRSTTNRVRENVFNLVGVKVKGGIVLDLFAGSGAFSCECLSRGAKHVIINDVDKVALEIVKQNTKGLGNNLEIFNLDYMQLLENLKSQIKEGKREKFSLVFLDPPYDSNFGEIAIDYITNFDMLDKGAIVMLECENNPNLNIDIFNIKYKKYGRTNVYILEYKGK